MDVAEASDQLVAALIALEIDARSCPRSTPGSDLRLIVDGNLVVLEVTARSLISDADTPGLQRWAGDHPGSAVIVADRITTGARDHLRQAGLGWLDLRGHLYLRLPGLRIDADVPAVAASRSASSAFSGTVALELASLILLAPRQPIGVRAAASTLGRAASTVSVALSGLRREGLVDDDGLPVLPTLFWELAQYWRPRWIGLHHPPFPSEGRRNAALELGFAEPADGGVGWALTGTRGAAAAGAPIGARTDAAPDFLLADSRLARRAVSFLGAAEDGSAPGARVAVSPVRLACATRRELPPEPWPVAQALFIALDLAQDANRGRAILETWTPEDGARVW